MSNAINGCQFYEKYYAMFFYEYLIKGVRNHDLFFFKHEGNST